jgi:hypothetical protein
MARIAYSLLLALTLLAALASAFFYAKVREREVVLDFFLQEATEGIAPTDTTALVLAVSQQIYRRTNRGIVPSKLPLYERIESTSFFNVTSTVSLLRGTYGVIGHTQLGPCGTMTRAMLGSLRKLNIPSRKLQLLEHEDGTGGSHTMLEFSQGGRWRVISPSDSSFVWRTRDGQIATLEEIRSDSVVFGQIFERYPRYPYRFDNTAHIRWTKLPSPIRRIMHWALGDQRYRDMPTPSLYDEPRRLFWYSSMAAFAIFGLLALIAKSLMTRRQPVTRYAAESPMTTAPAASQVSTHTS